VHFTPGSVAAVVEPHPPARTSAIEPAIARAASIARVADVADVADPAGPADAADPVDVERGDVR